MDISEPIRYNPNPNDIWLLRIYPNRSKTEVLYSNPICTYKFTRMGPMRCYKIEPKSESKPERPGLGCDPIKLSCKVQLMIKLQSNRSGVSIFSLLIFNHQSFSWETLIIMWSLPNYTGLCYSISKNTLYFEYFEDNTHNE